MKNFLFLLSSTAVFSPPDINHPRARRDDAEARKKTTDTDQTTNEACHDEGARIRRDRPRPARQRDAGGEDKSGGPRNADQRHKRAAQKERLRSALADHPLRLYRPSRVAALLDVDLATVWRWRRDGVLPPPVEIAGIKGWTSQQLSKLLRTDREGGDNAR